MYIQMLSILGSHSEGQQKESGKCPKISYTKVSDKMAYAKSADTDQRRSSLIWVYTVCHSIK